LDSNAWVHIYSKMMAIIIPVVVKGDFPLAADGDKEQAAGTGTNKVSSVEYYKHQNLNAEADTTSSTLPLPNHEHARTPSPANVTGGGGCPVIPKLDGSTTACPASGVATVGDDVELSHALQEHFRDNAATHMVMLGAEAAAQAAEAKYKVLTRVLSIAQRVEAHLRESGSLAADGHAMPMVSITGHKLLQLLHSHNWVSDAAGAKTAASYFLQLHLMQRVRVTTPVTAGDATDATTLQFANDDTVYTFASSVSSLTPPATAASADRHLIVPPLFMMGESFSTSDSFAPQCYVAELRPVDGILHALSPSPMPNLADVAE
jgi:hypothetical protein